MTPKSFAAQNVWIKPTSLIVPVPALSINFSFLILFGFRRQSTSSNSSDYRRFFTEEQYRMFAQEEDYRKRSIEEHYRKFVSEEHYRKLASEEQYRRLASLAAGHGRNDKGYLWMPALHWGAESTTIVWCRLFYDNWAADYFIVFGFKITPW